MKRGEHDLHGGYSSPSCPDILFIKEYKDPVDRSWRLILDLLSTMCAIVIFRYGPCFALLDVEWFGVNKQFLVIIKAALTCQEY